MIVHERPDEVGVRISEPAAKLLAAGMHRFAGFDTSGRPVTRGP